ncbi:MAG: hypothetical protein JWR38_2394 [Mucilaginibacter sp.]|nr:hypothetical protein [Mucilaginibacter sp.]
MASLLLLLQGIAATAQQITFADSAELFIPALVSTKNADVKITFSPDGKKMLWGGIDWIPDKKDMDIWQSEQVNGKWTEPARVTFDSDSNDFDPFFSPDGRGVYFFSNRLGGFGGDDIYFAAYNSTTNTYKAAVNLGDQINTPGNEWAPITDASARYLIFSSNGHGGFGGQDLFKAAILPSGYGKPINMGAMINSAEDDFDAVVLPDNALVFTSAKGKEPKADLYISYKTNKAYTKPVKLPAQINAAEFWTFGPAVNLKEPGYLYFSSHLSHSMGRTDIYRIKYTNKIYPK